MPRGEELPRAGGRPEASGSRRRRRLALGLVLVAFAAGALLAPGLLSFGEPAAPPRPLPPAPPPAPPLARAPFERPWHTDLSLGPLREMLEDGLRTQPVDVRRPLRVPLAPRAFPSPDQILLAGRGRLSPALVPLTLHPLPPAPEAPPRPLPPFELPAIADPGRLNPNGAPSFAPELLDGDDFAFRGPFVPEPSTGLLLGAGLVGLALRARRRRRA